MGYSTGTLHEHRWPGSRGARKDVYVCVYLGERFLVHTSPTLPPCLTLCYHEGFPCMPACSCSSLSICVQVWVASLSSPPFPSVCDSIVRLLSLFSVFPRPPPLLLLLLVSSCHVPLLSPSLRALIPTPLFLPLISEGDQTNHDDGERNIADSLSPPSKKNRSHMSRHGGT